MNRNRSAGVQIIASGLLSLSFALIVSCGSGKLEAKKQAASEQLVSIAEQINNDFRQIRTEVGSLAEEIQKLYAPETAAENLAMVDPSRYALYENGVFYKPVNDGKSAVFVSGVVPVNEEIKNIVYFTEPMDAVLMQITDNYQEVIQAYYNDKYSYNRIYPYFDVLTQYEPKMDIPAFNFYYLADLEHNPQKEAVWVNEPYVDPAGRGWMVSVIAPVYIDGKLEGVPGMDVTINTITDRYVKQEPGIVILDSTATVVSIEDAMVTLFGLPVLENHKYLETIRQDTYRENDFNLLKSKTREVRLMAEAVYNKKEKEVALTVADKEYLIITEPIPELDWKILKLVQ